MSSKRKYTTTATPMFKKARQFQKERPAKQSLQRAVAAAVRKEVEKKGVDFPLDVASVVSTTNGTQAAFCINLTQQGVGSWNRVGRKIQNQSIRLRGGIVWLLDQETTTLNLIGNTLRMVVVWDKQPSGTFPTFDTVFGVTGQDGTETTTFLNPVKYDNMDRFMVLRDMVCDFEPPLYNAAAGTQNAVIVRKSFDEYIRLGGKETTYLGQSNPATIADVSSGALYVYFRAAANVTNQNQLAIDSSSFARLRYTDM